MRRRFGVTGRALERGLWQLQTWNPRDFTQDNHRTVDDRPYGGGPGMVMLPEPLEKALEAARKAQREGGYGATRTIHLTPAGAPLTHPRVAALAAAGDATGYVLLAGRYEGLDERLVARASRRGDRDRRFRGVGRRAAGADADRRGGAAAAGRAERRRIGGAGFLRRRAARLSALHAARAVWWRARAGGAAVGQPRGDPPLARRSRRWEGHGSGVRTCCGSGRSRRKSRRCWRNTSASGASRSSSEARRPTAAPARHNQKSRASGGALLCAQGHRPSDRNGERSMNIIEKLEQEEIARLGKTDSRVRAGRHRDRQRERRRRRAQARAGLRRCGHREAQPRPQLVVRRAQDLERRGRRAHVPAVFAAAREHRGEAQGAGAPREALLSARPLRQVGADSREARPPVEGATGRREGAKRRRTRARRSRPSNPSGTGTEKGQPAGCPLFSPVGTPGGRRNLP